MVTSSGMYPFMRLRSGGHDTVPATRMMRDGLTTVSSVLRLAAMAFCTAFHACMLRTGSSSRQYAWPRRYGTVPVLTDMVNLGPAKAVTLRMLSELSASAKQ
jgi:hypothetical protein